RDGKRTKPPYDPRTGDYASVTDPATWTTFDAARTAACAGRYDGIGRVLIADERFVGIDLDHCRDRETGAIAPWAQQIVDALRSYTETTPSGEGLRIFVRGTLPPGGRRRGNVEVYDRDRYLTVTGAHLDGTPLTIEDRTAELAAVHARIFGVPPAPTNGQPPAEPVDLDDAALLDRAR